MFVGKPSGDSTRECRKKHEMPGYAIHKKTLLIHDVFNYRKVRASLKRKPPFSNPLFLTIKAISGIASPIFTLANLLAIFDPH